MRNQLNRISSAASRKFCHVHLSALQVPGQLQQKVCLGLNSGRALCAKFYGENPLAAFSVSIVHHCW